MDSNKLKRDHILAMIEISGLKASPLADKAGLNHGTVTKFLKNWKDLKYQITDSSLNKLAKASGFLDYFDFQKKYEQLNSHNNADTDYFTPAPSAVTSLASKGRNSDWDDKPKKKIPMFYAGAGEYMYPSSEPMDWVQPSERFTKTDRQIAFEVKGKSMEPAMWEGDVVYCYWEFDVVQKEAINKRSVVLCEDGRVLIKILEEGEKPGTYDLKSLNGHPPEYGVKLLAAAKIVDIVTK